MARAAGNMNLPPLILASASPRRNELLPANWLRISRRAE